MNRKDLLKRLRHIAKEDKLIFEKNEKRGKGSHMQVKFGSKKATVPIGELSIGTLRAICNQLGIDHKRL